MSKNFSCPGRDFFIETFLLGLFVCIPAEERMEMCSTMSVVTRTVKIVKKTEVNDHIVASTIVYYLNYTGTSFDVHLF